MTSLTILNDAEVKKILRALTKEEVGTLQQCLRDALHEYSTGTNNDNEECSVQQPGRVQLDRKNGTTTLFMASTSSSGIGMKVVTLGSPRTAAQNDPSPGNLQEAKAPTPRGALTLMDNDGRPFGFVNAEEITAFRTALASSLLIIRRHKVKEIVVFGAGKQAFWHVRLALMFHGSTITKVNIINHRFSLTAREFYKGLVGTDASIKQKEGWWLTKFGMLSPSHNEYERMSKDQIRAADIIFTMTPSTDVLFDHSILTNPNGRLKGRLIIATGSYKPHMIELPPELLMQAVKHHGSGVHFRKRAIEGGVVLVDTMDATSEAGEFMRATAEGKFNPKNVVELGEIVLLDQLFAQEDDDSAVDVDSSHESLEGIFTPDGRSSLSIALREHSMESGGSSKSPSRKSSFSNLSRKSSRVFRNRHGSHGSDAPPKKKQSKDEEEMSRWLHKGNVIYKSVGLGLMDLVVGTELVRLAREKRIGATFEDF